MVEELNDIVANSFNEGLRDAGLDRWCACGDNDEIDAAMLKYLTSGDEVLKVESTTDLFCAYISTILGWTEHGGSVYGNWLTPFGEDMVVKLKEKQSAN